MRKLDLILEDIRDEYMINLLEEGATSELETLKTKKFLNENLNRIRKMLIEEGALEGVKQHLGDNWGIYLSESEDSRIMRARAAQAGPAPRVAPAVKTGSGNLLQGSALSGPTAAALAGGPVSPNPATGDAVQTAQNRFNAASLRDLPGEFAQSASPFDKGEPFIPNAGPATPGPDINTMGNKHGQAGSIAQPAKSGGLSPAAMAAGLGGLGLGGAGLAAMLGEDPSAAEEAAQALGV